MVQRMALAVFGVLFMFAVPSAQTRYTFEAHSFTMTLPAGFSLLNEATPQPGFKRWAFATEPRADGLSGVIQVGLFDAVRMGGTPTIDEFVKTMGSTLQATYGNFTAQVHRVSLLGDSRLVQWSGTMKHPDSGAIVPLRGLLVVGSYEGLYFRLDVFDTEAMAPQTLQAVDLASFKLTVAPKKQD